MAQKNQVFTPDDDKTVVAEAAIAKPKVLKALVDALGGDERRLRQYSSSVISVVAGSEPALLKEYTDELADALHRPEAQTRWETLNALVNLVNVDARLIDKSLVATETALHDEESGIVRLAAFRLLAAYGATTAHRSQRVWPLMSEAIRCYHGDPEFFSMLVALKSMVAGGAADEVKWAAADLMAFDAENGKGQLKRHAKLIVDCAPKKRPKAKKAPAKPKSE